MFFFPFHAGLAFGLFLSATCETEDAALQASFALLFPTMLLCGVLVGDNGYDIAGLCGGRDSIGKGRKSENWYKLKH